jgi:hypothetical protein
MQFPLGPATASIKFVAILGDLLHKQDLYIGTQTYEVSTTCHFANCEQAGYLINFHPQLIPSGPRLNNHSLGTIFEYQYYTNLTFRFAYQWDFPDLFCYCI